MQVTVVEGSINGPEDAYYQSGSLRDWPIEYVHKLRALIQEAEANKILPGDTVHHRDISMYQSIERGIILFS
jgi:hypothetical protein